MFDQTQLGNEAYVYKGTFFSVFGVFVMFCLVYFGLVLLFVYLVWFVYLLVVEVFF